MKKQRKRGPLLGVHVAPAFEHCPHDARLTELCRSVQTQRSPLNIEPKLCQFKVAPLIDFKLLRVQQLHEKQYRAVRHLIGHEERHAVAREREHSGRVAVSGREVRERVAVGGAREQHAIAGASEPLEQPVDGARLTHLDRHVQRVASALHTAILSGLPGHMPQVYI